MKTRVVVFQNQFVQDIKDKIKRTTLRANARCAPGDILSFRIWTGRPRRSKQKIFGTAKCVAVEPVLIRPEKFVFTRIGQDEFNPKTRVDLDFVAIQDGFKSYRDLIDWFRKNHPGAEEWTMDSIYWEFTFKAEEETP